jgi:4-diphosphocytidyl-2-C-methyl-D-erythritol kinase
MLEALAPAKLTLSLRVVGTRADGMHELDALVVTVAEPHDLLTMTPGGTGVRVRVDGPASAGVPASDANLAAKAAHALARVDPAAADVDIAVQKGIPAGAGLGGGSADAAAVLRTMGAACGVEYEDVVALGAELGSDVPVCIRGGSAWMRGRGEIVEPVSLPTLRVLVVAPPFAVSTPAVYRAWDELGGPRDVRPVAAPPELATFLPTLVNDLEPAAEHVEPRLAGFRHALEEAAAAPALLAGSGSAYAVLCGDEHATRVTAARVHEQLGLPVHAALTLAAHPRW